MTIQPPDLKADNREAGDHYDYQSDGDVTEASSGCLQPIQAFVSKWVYGGFSHYRDPFAIRVLLPWVD